MSPRDSYDPFKDESLGQPKPRKKAVKIDWKKAARLWAEGAKPAAIAAQLGIEEDRIWRHLKRSLRFRQYLRQEMDRLGLQAEIEYRVAARQAVLDGAGQPQAGPPPWQLAEAGLAGAAAGPMQKGKDMVDRLCDTVRKRPSRAYQAKLDALQQEKDANLAVMQADLALMERQAAARQTARQTVLGRTETRPPADIRPAAASDPQSTDRPARTEPARTEMDSSGQKWIAADASGQKRAELDSSEPQRAEMDSSGPDWTPADENEPPLKRPAPLRFEPAPEPTVPSRASLYRTIIDLPGPDTERLGLQTGLP